MDQRWLAFFFSKTSLTKQNVSSVSKNCFLSEGCFGIQRALHQAAHATACTQCLYHNMVLSRALGSGNMRLWAGASIYDTNLYAFLGSTFRACSASKTDSCIPLSVCTLVVLLGREVVLSVARPGSSTLFPPAPPSTARHSGRRQGTFAQCGQDSSAHRCCLCGCRRLRCPCSHPLRSAVPRMPLCFCLAVHPSAGMEATALRRCSHYPSLDCSPRSSPLPLRPPAGTTTPEHTSRPAPMPHHAG